MVQKFSAYFLCLLVVTISQHVCAVEANTVVATIAVGVTPAGLAVTPDNRFAYVANNNNYGIPNGDTVSVIDLTTNLLVDTITTASFNAQAYTVTMNAAGTRAYVTNSNWTTVVVIDTATNTVVNTIDGFDGPSGFVITPDGNFAYVNNYGGPTGVGSGNATTVRVVDMNTETIVGAPITVDLAPAAIAVSPDGQFVYTANYVDGNTGTGTMSVIRTSDNTVVATIPGFSGPFAIAITPNGKYAYVTNFGSNNFAPIGTTVSVVDLTLNAIVATVDLSIQPSGIAITPDGRYAYATNYNTLYAGAGFTDLTAGEGVVNIIDTATNTVVAPNIAVGQSPSAVAMCPTGEFAYVSNFTSGTVSVIALQSFAMNIEGCIVRNKFLNETQWVNRLTIRATGASLPVSYSIYRDAQLSRLIATVPAQQSTIFLDGRNSSNTYYVVGTNRVGTRSAPVAVTVTQRC